jgi:hypothetical protein
VGRRKRRGGDRPQQRGGALVEAVDAQQVVCHPLVEAERPRRRRSWRTGLDRDQAEPAQRRLRLEGFPAGAF